MTITFTVKIQTRVDHQVTTNMPNKLWQMSNTPDAQLALVKWPVPMPAVALTVNLVVVNTKLNSQLVPLDSLWEQCSEVILSGLKMQMQVEAPQVHQAQTQLDNFS